MTIAVDLGRKATKQTNKDWFESPFVGPKRMVLSHRGPYSQFQIKTLKYIFGFLLFWSSCAKHVECELLEKIAIALYLGRLV